MKKKLGLILVIIGIVLFIVGFIAPGVSGAFSLTIGLLLILIGIIVGIVNLIRKVINKPNTKTEASFKKKTINRDNSPVEEVTAKTSDADLEISSFDVQPNSIESENTIVSEADIPIVQSIEIEPVIPDDIQSDSVEEMKEEVPEKEKNYESFKVSGISFYEENLLSLASENYDYEMTKREIIDAYMTDEKISKYDFPASPVELIEEPDNQYDPNAIKVVLNGVHIGYVPSRKCKRIKKILHTTEIQKLIAQVYGGDYKAVYEDYENEGKYNMKTGSSRFGAEIIIVYSEK